MSKKNQREKVRKNGQIEQQDGEKDYKEILVEQYDKGLLPTIPVDFSNTHRGTKAGSWQKTSLKRL